MVYAAALVLGLAASAVAAPMKKGTGLAGRLARRAGRQSKPLRPGTLIANSTNDQYDENWAGAVYASSSGTYTGVTGTFTVPTPSVPSGGSDSTTYAASAWVGIDGDTCDTAILQTGVDFSVQGSSVSYDAWYEWYPAYAYDFSGISFSAGDSVTVTVSASSTTSGTATIINNSNGQQVNQDLTSSSALCEENAEWIVEDFEESGGLVPFANFGTVSFTGSSATTSSGSVDASGASTIDIEQSGTILTSTSISGSTVTIQYTG